MFSQSRTAVSIEGNNLRVLSCRDHTVEWWMEVALEPRLLRNGFLSDVRGFAQAISASEAEGKVLKGHVVAALPGFQTFFRIIRVPKDAGRKLKAVVLGEARRLLPDVERNMFLSWQAFGPKDALQQSIFLLGVPRQPLITYLEALSAAGGRPKVLDLRPLALARSVNQQDAIIANSESMGLDVVIVKNDVPVAMRSIYLGEDFEQVEYVNSRLAEELIRTFTHFNATNQDGALAPDTPIYITGNGASDPNLVPMIRDMVQRPVVPLEPPFEYPDEFPVAKYMVHLGLLLK